MNWNLLCALLCFVMESQRYFADIHSSVTFIFFSRRGEDVNECLRYLCIYFCLQIYTDVLLVTHGEWRMSSCSHGTLSTYI